MNIHAKMIKKQILIKNTHFCSLSVGFKTFAWTASLLFEFSLLKSYQEWDETDLISVLMRKCWYVCKFEDEEEAKKL